MNEKEFICAIESLGFYVDDPSEFGACIWFAPDYYFSGTSIWLFSEGSTADDVEIYTNNNIEYWPTHKGGHFRCQFGRDDDQTYWQLKYDDAFLVLSTRYKHGQKCPEHFKVQPYEG